MYNVWTKKKGMKRKKGSRTCECASREGRKKRAQRMKGEKGQESRRVYQGVSSEADIRTSEGCKGTCKGVGSD